MAITYTWKVTGVKTRRDGPHLDAVVQTYWEKIGTDENGNQGRFTGATPFSAANVPVESFVPFEQLTEEIVLGWIKAVVVGSYEQHVNDRIAKEIDEKVNAFVDKPLPWAPAPGPVTPGTSSS